MKSFYGALFLVLGNLAAMPASSNEGQGYFLASIGKATSEFRTSPSDAIQGDDTAFEIGVGFNFSEYLAVEASYQDFGEPDGFAGCPPDVLCIAIVPFAREPVSIDGWSAALRGTVPISESFSAFGKLGFLAWDTSASNPGLNDSGTDLLYAVGIATELTERFSLQLSWEQAEVDIESTKLGVRLTF